MPFILYGVVQQILFYAGGLGLLEEYLPWDAAYVADILSTGKHGNLFQGSLLRFFGVMNSFVEYQVATVFLAALLWLNLDVVKRRGVVYADLVLAGLFLVLSLERSPTLMFIILLLVWQWPKLSRLLIRFPYIVLITFLVAVLLAGIIYQIFSDHPLLAPAIERMANAITLSFGRDEAISTRMETQWATALSLIPGSFFGIGPGRVSPAASEYSGYLAPHNNYFTYYLGYGMLGLAIFLGILVHLGYRFVKLKYPFSNFGLGMLLSFSLMAIFNVPFIGKQGIVFFLIAGFLSCREFRKSATNRG